MHVAARCSPNSGEIRLTLQEMWGIRSIGRPTSLLSAVKSLTIDT